MPLDVLPVGRQRVHARQMLIEGFQREDGLWDVEGSLTDTKDHDLSLHSCVRKAGDAIHCMRLRWTLDLSLTILAVDVAMDAQPYAGVCDEIRKQYKKLVGLRVGAGFRRAVGELFRGINGCSHVTELVGAMAAGSIQTLAPFINRNSETRPLQIGGCHAWAEDGPLVREHYPQWVGVRRT
ncbi:DUF2889 domain-containing protein [Caballeronia sp. GAWG2-1]|uniref:DUF2889 domain-containing protein n=1 Tax=Caballeronia sp. GAWG2-1 TaxID=2921744 RepID=UPI00202985D5|nr:DUF2889 domain-containing protein [Caballeronia sp. GAWG2-1]